jgi:AAA domain
MSITHISEEHHKEWNKVKVDKGVYNFLGPEGKQYAIEHLKRLLLFGLDPRSAVVFGDKNDQVAFLKKAQEVGITDSPDGEPELMLRNERNAPDGEVIPRSVQSEDDVEQVIEAIRKAKLRCSEYRQFAAIVVLNPGPDKKYLDRLLKIPYLMNGQTQHIELPVFIVEDTDGTWSDFFKDTNTTPSGVKQTLQLTRGDEIEEKYVEWLVPDFYPKNEVTICTGQMDTLKTTTNIDIAAAGSTFRPWFMGDQLNEYGDQIDRHPFITLYAASEDDPARTILPRYKAAGGNPDCIYFLKQVTKEKTTEDGLVVWEASFSLDEHIELLRENIRHLNSTREWPVGLLVLDPLITVFGNKNYNSPQDTNDLMVKLRRLCSEEQITVVGITHYNKTQGLVAKDKTSGSKRIVESARMAWGFDRAEGDSETTVISPIKKNLLAKAKSYKITTVDHDGVGVIKFLGFTEVTADEQIEAREDKGRGQRKEIKKEILALLKDGPMPVGDVYNQLRDIASLSSLKRAVAALLDEGKIKRLGTNPKNFELALATEAEQPTFDEVTNECD